jgi:hypothetical protein
VYAINASFPFFPVRHWHLTSLVKNIGGVVVLGGSKEKY